MVATVLVTSTGAMHKHLKGTRLRVVRANWMLQDDVEEILADPTLTAVERAEIETELERELVDALRRVVGASSRARASVR